jgi:nucleoid DNA-binding protein|tara:strand:- start:479 stop:775 length:297 start_codon:yes stop_codon:yes gene_type:complete
MTKQNIIDQVSEATGLTKVETEAVMNGVMTAIIESLAKNEHVELRGFGTFGVKHRKPKKARNPRTGAPIFLPERNAPSFKPAKHMRERVNDTLIINRK